MSVTALIASKSTTVTVQRASHSFDAGNSVVTSFSNHLTNVPMFMQPRGGDEAVRHGRETNQPFAVFYCAPDLDIKESDRLVAAGGEWDIQVVSRPGNIGGGAVAHMRIEAQEVRK